MFLCVRHLSLHSHLQLVGRVKLRVEPNLQQPLFSSSLAQRGYDVINCSDQLSLSRHAQPDIYFGKWKMTNMYIRIGSPSRQWLRLWLDRGPCCIHCIVAIAGFIVERRHVVPQNNGCEQWAGICPNLTSRRNRDSSRKNVHLKNLAPLDTKVRVQQESQW